MIPFNITINNTPNNFINNVCLTAKDCVIYNQNLYDQTMLLNGLFLLGFLGTLFISIKVLDNKHKNLKYLEKTINSLIVFFIFVELGIITENYFTLIPILILIIIYIIEFVKFLEHIKITKIKEK